MGIDEREKLLDKIEEESQYAKGVGQNLPENATFAPVGEHGSFKVDQNHLKGRINDMERAVREGTPPKLSKGQFAAAEREHAELGEWISKKALTRAQMRLLPKDNYDFQRAVRWSKEHEVGNPAYSNKCRRYKYLGQIIAPDDPEMASTEALRREK